MQLWLAGRGVLEEKLENSLRYVLCWLTKARLKPRQAYSEGPTKVPYPGRSQTQAGL